MARNDGIDRTSARNVNLTAAKIGNAQRHNEREKESYRNPSDVQKHDNIVEHVRTLMNLKNQANHARNATEKTVFERSINAVNDELNTLIDALYQVEAQENGDEE